MMGFLTLGPLSLFPSIHEGSGAKMQMERAESANAKTNMQVTREKAEKKGHLKWFESFLRRLRCQHNPSFFPKNAKKKKKKEIKCKKMPCSVTNRVVGYEKKTSSVKATKATKKQKIRFFNKKETYELFTTLIK